MSLGPGAGYHVVGFECHPPSAAEHIACCKFLYGDDKQSAFGYSFCLAVCVICCMACTIHYAPDTGTVPQPPPTPVSPPATVFTPSTAGNSFTTSEYGLVIPIVFGSDKRNGNVIWSSEFVDHIVTIDKVAYSYTTVSFALGLCEGEINGVLRVWLGDQLIIDNSMSVDGNNKPVPQADGQILSGIVDLTSANSPLRNTTSVDKTTRVTVFTGAETQIPEGIMATTEGYSFSPAYRGLAYILFENFILTGGSIPDIKVEVMAHAQNLLPRQYGDWPSPEQAFDQFLSVGSIIYDPSYDNFHVSSQDSSGSGTPVHGKGYTVLDGNDLSEVSEHEIISTFGLSLINVDFSKTVLLSNGSLVIIENSGNAGIIHVFNPFSGNIDTSIGPGGGIGGHSLVKGFAAMGAASGVVVAAGADGRPLDHFYGIGDVSKSIGFAQIDENNVIQMRSVFNGVIPKQFNRSATVAIAADFPTRKFYDGFATTGLHIFIFGTSPSGTIDDTIYVSRITVDNSSGATVLAPQTDYSFFNINTKFIGGAGTLHLLKGVLVDPIDKCFVLVFTVSGAKDYFCKWSPFTGEVLWATPVAKLSAQPYPSCDVAYMPTQKFGYLDNSSKVWTLDLKTGFATKQIDSLSAQNLPSPLNARFYYNGYENSITYCSATAGKKIVKVYLERISRNQVLVSDIISDLLLRVGASRTDIIVDDLTVLSADGYTIDSIKSLTDDDRTAIYCGNALSLFNLDAQVAARR